MLPIQDFCIANIYRAPKQDKQFNFSLVRLNKELLPVRGKVVVYNTVKNLPDNSVQYHVFAIGNLSPILINLLRQGKDWFRDTWINIGEDMDSRNYIFKLYNDDGVLYPSENVFYSFIDENSLLIAMKFDFFLKSKFDVGSFKFIHVYSSAYFHTTEYGSLPVKLGIKYLYKVIESNVDKVALQTSINDFESNGGKAIVYVDGYITDELTLGIPNFSVVEVIYDQSIISREVYSINDLRTFTSTKDNKLKYLVFRDGSTNFIQYNDDTEIYISTSLTSLNDGTYFYKHNDFAMRNVTDKDYSLYTVYINNQAQKLSDITGGSIVDKNIILYVRKPGLVGNLIFSNLKLHELYKLTPETQLNTLLGTGPTLTELRAETLEDSDYFKIASEVNFGNINSELCSNAVGYNSIAHYFGNNPVIKVDSFSADVPQLYQGQGIAFEYDINGKYLSNNSTSGPIYLLENTGARRGGGGPPSETPSTTTTEYVEFLYGKKDVPDSYYLNGDVITLRHTEYKVLSAVFIGPGRITDWVDITDDITKVVKGDGDVTISVAVSDKVKIFYFNEVNHYDITLPIADGLMFFPLTVDEDRGTGVLTWPVDVAYSNIEIYLNGSKLIQGLDFFMKFPFVNICNKKYIDYTKAEQDIHIRMYGFNLDITKINDLETKGFINHGVLSRNKKYDLRDDRLLSIYVDGKLKNRNNLIFAEEDNTVRISDSMNGLPYVIKEPYTPIKDVTGLETDAMFNSAKLIDDKMSTFFNLINPEGTIDETNAIVSNYFIFSPTISKVIHDILSGVILESEYINQYDDNDILTLINNNYLDIYDTDPVRFILPDNIVIFHPHLGNSFISLNLHQYRYVLNVARVIASDNITISDLLVVTT